MSQNCSLDCKDTSIIEYLDVLYRYAMSLTRNRTEAEDLVQETYLRAIKALKTLQADSNIKSWLMTILRNIWLNELRARFRTPRMVDIDGDEGIANEIVEAGKDPCSIYLCKRESEYIQAAIQQLSSGLREIILMREFESMSYQEIASVLNCPLGTVMSRLARARTKLRTLLLGTSQPISDPTMSPSIDQAAAD